LSILNYIKKSGINEGISIRSLQRILLISLSKNKFKETMEYLSTKLRIHKKIFKNSNKRTKWRIRIGCK